MKIIIHILVICILYQAFSTVLADDVLGCGGFIKSHVPMDFSKVEIKLVTKQGTIKDKTTCAPNSGYYFVPLYDKGEFSLQVSPPPGWSFTPKEIHLNIDGTDPCSQGKDLNFVFEGFGIAGKVESLGSLKKDGPEGVLVELLLKDQLRSTKTDNAGLFSFSPVFPGTYHIKISHPRWKIYKGSVVVEVTEGNTEVPRQSLIIQGYDVTGNILTADGDPVKNATLLLFTKENEKNILVENCNKKGFNANEKSNFLCSVSSDPSGKFIFPVVPTGSYFLTPYYVDENIHYQPERVDFFVQHKSLQLEEKIRVIGFSITGKVTNGDNVAVTKANIYLNGNMITSTDKNGIFKLEKLKAGEYKLKAEADSFIFNEITVDIDMNMKNLPDLIPSAFKVCGKVISGKSQTVTFYQIETSRYFKTETNDKHEFCHFLPAGKYEVQVDVSEDDKQNGLPFFPLKQIIDVSAKKIEDLIFSPLKSDVSGRVNCINKNDCEGLLVNLKSDFKEFTVPVEDSFYSVENIQPGTYVATLSQSNFCWKNDQQTVNVNAAKVEIPSFIQIGYLVTFSSSHEAKISYKSVKQGKTTEFLIQKGTTSICLESAGQYTFSINSCHDFGTNIITYDTGRDSQLPITLNAEKHKTIVSIGSDTNHGPIEVKIKNGTNEIVLKVNFSENKYEIELMLKPSDVVTLTPKSDLLLFVPSFLQVEGSTDCKNLGAQFSAVKGVVFEGHIVPPLDGVQITVEDEKSHELYNVETGIDGYYKFPPLNPHSEYKVSAKKESYIFTGPDSSGKFYSQKLAEIIVEISDKDDKSPLAGVLISLSGDESFRRNLQSNTDGKVSFFSLSAGDYFLRPMMKEYQFEPSSSIIKISEGQTVTVKLTGKRVAFSAFGKLTSVNDDPVDNVNIIASGIDNCTGYSEDATTDNTGLFRIRGLQPYCSFKIWVQVGSGSVNLAERTSPEFVTIENIQKDIKNLHITVFRPVLTTDVLLKVYAENVDHYKQLKITVYRETNNAAIIYSSHLDKLGAKVDKGQNNGILVHLPSLNLDGNEYSVHLEPVQSVKGKTEIVYFQANSTFKHIVMKFAVKSNTKEQTIEKTSVWAVVSILIILLSLNNIQLIVDLIREHFNFNLNWLGSYIPVPNNSKIVNDYDNDIDQIVHDINNVRRNRSKKSN